ncbi:MAG TPA: hypothetical protein VGQ92_27600 [Actinoplanes sp.]|nr:hypothetical protein [Actinoplanes sp.]
MATVADYIALRRADNEPHQVVGRLGPPEALAAAAQRGAIPPHLRRPAAAAPPPVGEAPGASDYAAVGLLTAGAFMLPVLSPLAGLLIATGSPRWTPVQKAAAWVLTAGSVGCSLLFLLIAAASAAPAIPLAMALVTLVAGSFIAGLSLLPGLSPRR